MLELLGFVAATLTTISFLPQALKAWKTKSTKDISLLMYTVMGVGVTCWLLYGLGLKSRPIIYANVITLILILSILFLKIKHK